MKDSPIIYVIGSGAIGALYSCMLQKAGYRIFMQCRSNYNHIYDQGFHVHTKWGDTHFIPDLVISHVHHLKQYISQIDMVLIATKVLDPNELKSIIEPFSDREIPLIYLQNGIHIEGPYIQNTSFKLIAGIPFVCVSQFEMGYIDHQDYGLLVLGDFPSGISDHVHQIADAFRSVGVPIRLSDQIQTDRWEKLMWNAALSVIYQQNTTELLSNPKIELRVRGIMQDVIHLAKADHCDLDENLIDEKIQATINMEPYFPSMALDYRSKRPMEIDAILGNALMFAKKKYIKSIHLESVYQDLINYIA